LGSGSGGWSDVLIPKVINGLSVIDKLTVFSFTYDCNNDVIEMLLRNCGQTLAVLDVAHSSQVQL